jgi:selenophosphate synthase
VTQRPDLIEHTSITPDVTGCGVFVIMECLRGCPLDRNFPSMRDIEVLLLDIS